MKKQLHYITIIILLAGTFSSWAQKSLDEMYLVVDTINGEPRKHYYSSEKVYREIQEDKVQKIEQLEEAKRLYESNLRTELAERIEGINARVGTLENYTAEMAQKDKEATAARYAEKISKHHAMIDAQIEYVKVSEVFNNANSPIVASIDNGIDIKIGNDKRKAKKRLSTTSGLSLGVGYNFINGDNLDINDFSYANNNYFSLGFFWKTALNEKQTVRLLYGLEYQSLGTELNGNRAFTINPDNTQIERLSFDADKAKFRQDQLVFPLHFEFGGSNRKEYEDGRVRYDHDDKFKIGLGGYGGFNLSSRLKYKYELAGEDIKQTTVNAFDNNALVYGVDAYVGWGDLTIFGRMGLNDIFKSDSVDGQYTSFGLRWQWD